MVDEMVKKRFTHINEDIFQYGEWYCSAGGAHCADVITTALNMLTTENDELKHEHNKCVHRRMYDANKVADLEKENQKLKQQFTRLKNYLRRETSYDDEDIQEIINNKFYDTVWWEAV